MAALTAANLPAGYGTDLVGVIISYPKDTLPTGFLACDGSAVSRTTYSDLNYILKMIKLNDLEINGILHI